MAAILIGVARGVFVVLDQGHIVDTIINFLVTPLARLPVTLFAMGITIVQSLLTLPPATVVHTGHGDDTTIAAEAPHLAEWVARGH